MHSLGWYLHLVCLVLFILLCGAKEDRFEIHARAVALFNEGNSEVLLHFLDVVEKQYKTLALVKGLQPSLYAYRGVVLYNAMLYEEAANDFKKAVIENPTDTRSFINLGQVQAQLFQLEAGIESFEQAVALGTAMSVRLRACVCRAIHGMACPICPVFHFPYIFCAACTNPYPHPLLSPLSTRGTHTHTHTHQVRRMR
jgi:tetratricopeptide (TPR) repeat protein